MGEARLNGELKNTSKMENEDMFKRRDVMKTTLVASLAMGFSGRFAAAADNKLSWKHFPAGENGFDRAPVLVMGPTEAVLLGGGFRLSDGKAVADAIQETGKKLTTIYVTVNDPDYYFSLAPIKAAFPDVKVIAAPETVEAIKDNVAGKIEAWGPQLGEDGPKSVDEVVMPEASDVTSLSVDGETIEIVTIGNMHDRRYFWVPSLEAVFDGTLVYGGLHLWMADNPTAEDRKAWLAALDGILAHNPKIVVAGHATPDSATDTSLVSYTRDYILAYEEELPKAKDSEALIDAMKKRYPDAGSEISLEIGAKVVKGEMKWG